MTRLFLLILLALGVALYIPESRAAVLDFAMPVLNPALRWQTQQEMTTIADEVLLYERDNPGRVPPPRSFPAWLQANFTPGATQDSWGGTYLLFVEGQTFVVTSWGADRKPRTADDLRVVRRLSVPPR